jgi:hypothetical protein
LWAKRGNFLNTDTGAVVSIPVGWTPILAGPWPNQNVGARQARCDNCNGFVGISMKGWGYHLADPACHPIFCERCMRILMDLVRMMDEARTPSA